jgi:hypothetical protein
MARALRLTRQRLWNRQDMGVRQKRASLGLFLGSIHKERQFMANSNLLGEENLDTSTTSATGTDSLGPSDSSDTGSDTVGTLNPDEFHSDSDRYGTGERAAVESKSGQPGADILPDHLVGGASSGDDAKTLAEADDAAQDEVEQLSTDAGDSPSQRVDHPPR